MRRLRRRLWRIALWCAYRLQLAYWFLFRPTEDSAHVALWWDGRVLITHSSYRAHVSLPAGGVKRRETPVQAACRELREEVGVAVEPSRLRPAALIVSRQQFKEDRAHVFELLLDRPPEIAVDGREVVRAELATPAEAAALRISAVLRDYLEGLSGAPAGSS